MGAGITRWKDKNLLRGILTEKWEWKMQAAQLKRVFFGLCVAGLLAVPAEAQVQSVTLKTSRNVGFF